MGGLTVFSYSHVKRFHVFPCLFFCFVPLFCVFVCLSDILQLSLTAGECMEENKFCRGE